MAGRCKIIDETRKQTTATHRTRRKKGRAHREFVPFLLKIILIYRNVCTVLKTIFTCKQDAADPQDLRLHQEF